MILHNNIQSLSQRNLWKILRTVLKYLIFIAMPCNTEVFAVCSIQDVWHYSKYVNSARCGSLGKYHGVCLGVPHTHTHTHTNTRTRTRTRTHTLYLSLKYTHTHTHTHTHSF